jgi:hypothetical protein
VVDESGDPTDLSQLAVPLVGCVVATGDRFQPYRLLDAAGVAIPAADAYSPSCALRPATTQRAPENASRCYPPKRPLTSYVTAAPARGHQSVRTHNRRKKAPPDRHRHRHRSAASPTRGRSHAEGTTRLAVAAAIEHDDRVLLVATMDNDFQTIWQLPSD